MNNGQMKESGSRLAVLEDVEVDTFIAFCEYAYTGRYTVPSREDAAVSEDGGSKGSQGSGNLPVGSGRLDGNNNTMETGNLSKPTSSQSLPQLSRPISGGVSTSTSGQALGNFPRGGGLGGDNTTQTSSLFQSNSSPFGQHPRLFFGTASTSTKPPSENPPSQFHISQPKVQHPYDILWETFTKKHYSFFQAASISYKPDLLFHAKLCVFATRYLVLSLQTQCLISLHRDLESFKLSTETASQILDLLEYTYENTGKQEPGGKCRLRDLVIYYVACKSQILADNERFERLLDENGEMGSDLVMKLVKQKASSSGSKNPNSMIFGT